MDLSGVPETLLGNLGRRAAAARIGVLKDPMAIQVVERLEYEFVDSARGARLHAARVATFDSAIRRFLSGHPAGPVVVLGEGLETQCWRVDNGSGALADRGPARDLRDRCRFGSRDARSGSRPLMAGRATIRKSRMMPFSPLDW